MKPDNPLAFSRAGDSGGDLGRENGMTLRDYFAAQVIIALLTPRTMFGAYIKSENTRDAARVAYEVADEMLAEREK